MQQAWAACVAERRSGQSGPHGATRTKRKATDLAAVMEKALHTLAYEDLVRYLTAEFGHRLCLWDDGRVAIVEASVSWRDGPIAETGCPGIGNLDSTKWTDDFVERSDDDGLYYEIGTGRLVGDLAAVIRECCRDGDVEDEMDDLRMRLRDDFEERRCWEREYWEGE
jgi:hypothetical protein